MQLLYWVLDLSFLSVFWETYALSIKYVQKKSILYKNKIVDDIINRLVIGFWFGTF